MLPALLLLLLVGDGNFFTDHWSRPLAPQGRAPAGYDNQAIDLSAEACGLCHHEQIEAWRESRHAHAMGPGIRGQLGGGWLVEENEERCYDCHAPLAEQKVDETLAAEGVTCSACHVRKHLRYGPPSSTPSTLVDPPHGGFIAKEAFGDSRFCAACHQFTDNDRRVNGKLLEDTWRQWRASRYAKENFHCPQCHMPDRRHRWAGIHDKEMVAQGVDIAVLQVERQVTVTVTNSGVGHFFPTYVTPQVQVALMDGDTLVDEGWIGWKVSLDLEEEVYDTRLPPDGVARFVFTLPKGRTEGRVVVTVYPDEFYHRFYNALLDSDESGLDRALLTQARDAAASSPYVLFEQPVAVRLPTR